jgi:hypothetical protein
LFCVNRLLKITFAVKQTDADKAETQVAGGFRVVAGEDAEAARRNRQRFVETELGGKYATGFLCSSGACLMAQVFLSAR